MNLIYVTVSIPLLLVLVGFNHAHGLTTFGKSGNAQTPPPQYHVPKRSCTSQINCTLIKGTTCLNGFCFCGDNSHPVNGACAPVLKGPQHICTKKEECVKHADCLPAEDQSKVSTSPNTPGHIEKVCTCEEDYFEVGGLCGASTTTVMSILLVITTLCRIIN